MIAGLSWFIQKLLFELSDVNTDIQNLFDLLSSLQEHIESVYELEMFYGDQTLESLMDHARSLNEQLDTFEYIYSLTETEEEIDEQPDPPTET